MIRCPRQCKHPLCALCCGFKASSARRRISALLDIVRQQHSDPRMVFVGLGTRNRPLDQFPQMFTDQETGLKRFWKLPEIQAAFIGQVTSIECAVRGDEVPAAGVHSHSIVVLHKDYFRSDRNLYIDNYRLSALWAKACGITDYRPIVDIRPIKGPDGETDPESLTQSVRELIKYSIAPHKLFERDQFGVTAKPEVLRVLLRTLWKRRTVRYGGVVAEAQKIQRQRAKAAAMESHDA